MLTTYHKKGTLAISLDFELLWGMADRDNCHRYCPTIEGGRKAIPPMLELFKKYGIHATWGVVGLICAENKDEMLAYSPALKPTYTRKGASAYDHFDDVGNDEEADPYYYGLSLVRMVKDTDNQEIGTHTYSHYYCDEPGQTVEQFIADVRSAQAITENKTGVKPSSLIFPRNNFKKEYLSALESCGVNAVRGNPSGYAWDFETMLSRALRLIETYICLPWRRCYCLQKEDLGNIVNVKASCFFRKYNPKLSLVEPLKISCIKHQMKYAAKHGLVFHLWWHPHNLGMCPEQNLAQFETLFQYYSVLKEKYGFESKNMAEIAQEILR